MERSVVTVSGITWPPAIIPTKTVGATCSNNANRTIEPLTVIALRSIPAIIY